MVWGLFLERDASALFGQQVTIRANRFGFGMLHVTDIVQGSTIPPPARERRSLVGFIVVAQGLGVLTLLWSIAQLVWAPVAEYVL